MYTAGKWRLRSLDNLNIVIEEQVEIEDRETGEKRKAWKIRGYYGGAGIAFASLANQLVNDALRYEAVTAVELANLFEKIKHDIMVYCRKHEGKRIIHGTPLQFDVDKLQASKEKAKQKKTSKRKSEKKTKQKAKDSAAESKPKTVKRKTKRVVRRKR